MAGYSKIPAKPITRGYRLVSDISTLHGRITDEFHRIEVTLTTLLSLEKLMHLIRARSEALDTLNLRLDWEEQRLAVWDMRGQILSQLKNFALQSTWSSAFYDADHGNGIEAGPSTLSGSAAISTTHAQTPDAMVPLVLSTSARARRRKTADEINATVQAIASQLRAFRRDTFPLPGATLDRMIETSSKKIPEVFLDEQDKVEDETRPLDSIDKFYPGLHMQWKK